MVCSFVGGLVGSGDPFASPLGSGEDFLGRFGSAKALELAVSGVLSLCAIAIATVVSLG